MFLLNHSFYLQFAASWILHLEKMLFPFHIGCDDAEFSLQQRLFAFKQIIQWKLHRF